MEASVTKKKQVCRSCRQRKKRCDGARPSCSLCRKLNISCSYIVSNSGSESVHTAHPEHISFADRSRLGLESVNHASEPHQSDHPNPLTGECFELKNGIQAMQRVPTMETMLFGMVDEGTPASFSNPDMQWQQNDIRNFDMPSDDAIFPASLPPLSQLLELVDIFFSNCYAFLPCFHKSELFRDVESGLLQTQTPALLYAIAAISARFHPESSIRACGNDWFEQAKFLYELLQRDSLPALRTLQAGICIIYHAWTVGDYSTSWLALGKTWRQTCSYGFNQLDAEPKDKGGLALAPPLKNEREKEELRRVLWTLFFFDRNESWATGWPHAVADRHYLANLPSDDSIFQHDVTRDDDTSVPFYWNLNELAASMSKPTEHINTYHYLIKAYVMLGRATDHIHALHDRDDPSDYERVLESLDSHLIRFRLSLPRSVTRIHAASPEEYSNVVWLTFILNTVTILVHYRASSTENAALNDTHFLHCLSAARNTAQMVLDMSRISSEPLLNPHIPATIYLACAIIIIQWRETKDDKLKSDIDILQLVFDRFSDVFPSLGNKFRNGIAYDLDRSEESIRNLKMAGAKGLLGDCARWEEFSKPAMA